MSGSWLDTLIKGGKGWDCDRTYLEDGSTVCDAGVVDEDGGVAVDVFDVGADLLEVLVVGDVEVVVVDSGYWSALAWW